MDCKLAELVRAFEDFEERVNLLENFRSELKSLKNTTGFEEDVRGIRAKLNNVDEIPFVKTRLEELKEKIQRKKGIRKEQESKEFTTSKSKDFEEPKIELIDKEGHGQKLQVYPEPEEEPKERPRSLEKDAEMLEKYGFKVKGLIKFKK